jgi:hypothetical protein
MSRGGKGELVALADSAISLLTPSPVEEAPGPEQEILLYGQRSAETWQMRLRCL